MISLLKSPIVLIVLSLIDFAFCLCAVLELKKNVRSRIDLDVKLNIESRFHFIFYLLFSVGITLFIIFSLFF